MKINYSSLRRLALSSMALLGGGLLLATGITSSVVLGILGVACWMVLLLGLLVGARFRMATVTSLLGQLSKDLDSQRESGAKMQRYLREELGRSRRFQARVTEKMMLNEKAARQRSRRVTETLQLVQLEQRDVTLSLVEAKRSMIDSQVLVLRAFQDASGQLDEVRSALGSRLDTMFDGFGNIDEMLRAQKHVSDFSSSLDEQLGLVAGELERVDGLVAHLGVRLDEVDKSIDGIAAAGRDMVAGFAVTVDQAVAPMRGRVDMLGANVDAFLEKGGRILENDQKLQGLFRRGGDWIRHETVQEVEALYVLRDLLQLRGPAPLLGGWAIDPTVMLALVRHVLDSAPETVLECGTGASTIWISRALEVAGRGRLVALEHDEVYAIKARALLERQGLSRIAQVVSAPIRSVEIEGKHFQWYTPEAISTMDPTMGPIGLLLVDGPPKRVGPLSRYPALPLLAPRLADGAVIVVDDYNRDEERKMVRLWRQENSRLGPPKKLSPRAAMCVWSEVDCESSQAPEA